MGVLPPVLVEQPRVAGGLHPDLAVGQPCPDDRAYYQGQALDLDSQGRVERHVVVHQPRGRLHDRCWPGPVRRRGPDLAGLALDSDRRGQPRRGAPGPRALAPLQVHGRHRRPRLPVRRAAHHRRRRLRQPGDRAVPARVLQRRRRPGERQPRRHLRRPPAPLRVHDLGRREGALHRHPEVRLLLRRGPGRVRYLRTHRLLREGRQGHLQAV